MKTWAIRKQGQVRSGQVRSGQVRSGQVRSGQAKLNQTRNCSTDSLSNPVYRTKSGVSMLISLGLVFVIMFFSLIVGNVVVTSIRQSSNVNRSTEAYYAAEGALEKGLLENFKQGAGYTSDVTDAGYTGVDATYEIQGQVPEDVKYINNSAYENMYGIPTPGTGNAGKECDPLNPVISGNTGFTYLGVTYTSMDAADHPCNWNKIKTGETVAIPLYYTDPSTGNAVNLFTDNNQELYLRVRTPCADGSDYCSAADRFTLDFFGDADFPVDDPVLTWQISGVDSVSGKAVVLSPYNKYDDYTDELAFPQFYIISEKKLYATKTTTQEVFNKDSIGLDLNNCKGFVFEFLNDIANTAFPGSCPSSKLWNNQTITKPVFKITAISDFKASASQNVPYLEYQIITSSNLAGLPTNESQTIKAEGISGTFKQVLEVKQPQEGGLPEYVVQQ